MSFDLIEGFDYYPANEGTPGIGLRSTWTFTGLDNLAGHFLAAGRFEAKSCRLTQYGGYTGTSVRLVKAAAKKVWGFAFKVEPLGNTDQTKGFRFFELHDSDAITKMTMRVNYLGVIMVCGTLTGDPLISSTRRILDNTWHYIEVEYEYGENGRIKLYIDGESQGEFLGNTKLTGDKLPSRVVMKSDGTYQGNYVNSYIDDLYLLSDVDKALGECRIQLLEAQSNQDVQFEPSAGANWQNISEASADGDATYNAANTPGFADYFNFTKITVNPDVIHAVGLVMAARKQDSGTRQIRSVLKSGPVASYAGFTQNLVAQYIWTRDIVEKDPNGNLPWQKTGVNLLKVGYELVL